MSLAAFQQVLADLVMSPALRTRVQEDPGAGLAPFDLTDGERQRLIAMAADPGPGVRTCTVIHRSFRLSMLANTLPLTCRALGAEGVSELMQVYWQEHLPQNFYYRAEARRFGGFALERFARPGFAHPVLPEVLETELAAHDLADSPHRFGAAGASAVTDDGIEAALAAPDAWTPRLHPACRVLRFRRDPAAVLAALKGGRAVPELPEGEHFLLVVALPDHEVDYRVVDPASGRLLLACDGTESLAALTVPLAMGEDGQGGDIAGRVRALASAEYLELQQLLPACVSSEGEIVHA